MRIPLTVACIATLAACGTQIGTETDGGCEVASSTTLTDTSVTPDGFDAPLSEALARVEGSFDGTFTYASGGTEALTLTVTRTGDPVFEHLQEASNGSGIEPALAELCADRVRVPVTVTVSMGTALDETYTTSVDIAPDGTAALYASQDLASVQGDLRPVAFDASDMAKVTQVLAADRDDLGWQGSVAFLGESRPSGTGPDSTVSQSRDELGTFELAAPNDTDL